MINKNAFSEGIRGGIPIALGYFPVAFGIGIAAVSRGLSPLAVTLMSLTNLTSAGQVAGIEVILAGGTFLEMALTELTINLRYFLMSLALSQKLDARYPLIHRFLNAFGITDEIFGVASARKGTIVPAYMYGLILLPCLGWTLGTLCGAIAGNILPDTIKNALGIAIYGMFIAIVLPGAKHDRGVRVASLLAVALSLVFTYVPFFSFLTSGFSIILCTVIASAIAAAFFPIRGETEAAEAEKGETDKDGDEG